MDESEDNLSSEDLKSTDSPLTVRSKPKKRSLIERELETSLTARITSPVTHGDGTSTSRYGRARRLKSEFEHTDTKKVTSELKSPLSEKSPVKSQTQSPVYKMHASNSPLKRTESPKKVIVEKFLDDQIESIYQENISLSRFGNEEVNTVTPSPAKKFPKVYIRKDLIQKREPEDTVMVIQNMFSPIKSTKKSSNTHLNNILERSSERYSLSSKAQNGYLDNSSVVKTLDFDGKKKKKEKDTKDIKTTPSKSELFELEARCAYQVGDLAWARMGTYPFWPSIVTRDPSSGIFVKKKLFGRIERDIIHVTFFGDNGRRGWIVDTMLRKYLGQLEFETTRENFTPEDKKKDPRLYAAYFVSEKKQPLWSTSVEEAEMLLREPKRLRIDIFNDMLEKSRSSKVKQPKSKISRTDSDVSLSESLYDSLFSEDDGKSDNNDRSRNRSRNKSLDMFEVVTACLDNMAAKTGITKIQRQSHMDRWLQKAKSKTPEKTKAKTQVPVKKIEEKKEVKVNCAKKKKSLTTKRPVQKSYSLRNTNEFNNLQPHQNEHDYSVNSQDDSVGTDSDQTSTDTDNVKQVFSKEINGICTIAKIESLAQKTQEDSVKNEETMPHDVSTTSGSPKDSSIDINGTCVSDTYTDDDSQDTSRAGNSGNNNTIDEENTDMQRQNDHKSEDLDTESQNSAMNLPLDKKQDTEVQNTVKLDSSKLTITTRHLDLSIDDDQNESSNRSMDLDISNIDSQDNTKLSVPSADLDLQIDNTTENQDNTVCRLRNKYLSTESSEISSTNEDSQSQTTSIDESSIETDYVSQVSSIIQEPIENNINKEVFEVDDDDDSDSERLPYSPLSNLGNNSDDNLSLDDAPFVSENITEFAKQDDNLNTKETDNDPKNRNGLGKEHLNSVDVSENHGQIETMEDELKNVSMEIDNSLTESMLANGHISDFSDIQSKKEDIFTIQQTNVISEPRNTDAKIPIKNITDKSTQDVMENIASNGYRGEKVREIEMASKEIRIYVSDYKTEPIKINGFHDMNGDFDVETASVHSEDSVTSSRSESKRKQRSKQEKIQEDPLENPEFVKYMELRQDAIIDENPELSEKEIVAYLYKTWLYEESVKSDVKKNDDLRECNLVKGLNQPSTPSEPSTRTKRNLSLKKQKPPQRNTLYRFLRKTKNVERKSDIDNDEVCLQRKRGARKNMIKYDDEDDMSVDEEEIRVIRESFKNVDSSSAESGNRDKYSENQNEKLIESTTSTDKQKSNDDSIKLKEKHELGSPKYSVIQSTLSIETAEEATENRYKIVKQKDTPAVTRDPIKITIRIDKGKLKDNLDRDSLDSEDSEAPLIKCKLRSKSKKENSIKESSADIKIKDEDADTVSINSEDSEISVTRRKKRFGYKKVENAMEDPEFVKYLELRQDALIEENPELTQDEIVAYLYQTWLYEQNTKSDIKRTDEMEQASLVKGLTDGTQQQQTKKVRRKMTKTERTDKEMVDDDISVKDKPKRKSVKPFYNEEYSDIEEELEVYEIFKPKNKEAVKVEPGEPVPETEQLQEVEVYDEVELYFAELTKPKPNIFKGLIREKVCEICEKVGSLVKCKGCNGMFHINCVKKQMEIVDVPVPSRGRKKKKKPGRKPKNSEEFDTDDRSQDVSEDNNASIEEILEAESHTVDADVLEAQLSAKMKEILDSAEKVEYDSYSSDDGHDWSETVPGKCEIIDVKLKPRHSASELDYADFKCNNCQNYSTPVCFVCKGVVSKNESTKRQKCHVAHCHKYYHLECLDHWPQTQFNGGEPSKNNKKINEYFEALTCPRHVCHTCVSDDPRGCKTRFSGDKLARCVRCPATYHSFTKCLPAGTQILTASHIICPRHYQHRPGKVPCHVNTGWCFICALGGSLICCEYCPTSFHAECLNIDPPEGGYMCEDCETGRLPLYGEMVWVKLGHYRWWPGIILHPYEIPENLMAVKHSLGEFVVRFFGQYDHYWVNRGRVFPFQEGDSGRISSQKSKIDAAFTTAMEHAQRACEILKTAQPNEEESLDIASSLLPPHYVKLKVNKPCGSLCGRRLDDPESSLTQCDCNPRDDDPCGPYSQCLNRMLLTECGPTCRAGDRCNNRAFEKRLYPKLVPYRTPSRGWGLKTLEDIKAGQFVIEYVGELIDEEETRRRMRRKHEMRDENFYFLTLDKERMIDAGPKGNLARFMNHCCEPNCETQKWTVLGDVRVGLFALYDIPAHSEVTFNYNLECAGIDKKRCMCGAKRCSGYIGAKPKQDESQTKKNKLQPGKRSYKKRKPEESPSTKNKPKRPIGRPPKPRELTEIEKDLLIIRNATNGLSSDESSRSLSSEYDRNPKALKRKRVSFSTEEIIVYDGTESPSVKKNKLDERIEGD